MRAYGRFAAAGPRRARVGAVPAVIAGTQGQRVLAGGWGASGINVVDLSAALSLNSIRNGTILHASTLLPHHRLHRLL